MTRNEDEIDALFGRQYALESMLTHLIWAWAKDHPSPPTLLANYFRPIEQEMARLAAENPGNAGALAGLGTVRGMAESLEQILQAEALRRTDGEGPVQ